MQSMEDKVKETFEVVIKLEPIALSLNDTTNERLWACLDGIVLCPIQDWLDCRMSLEQQIKLTSEIMEQRIEDNLRLFKTAGGNNGLQLN